MKAWDAFTIIAKQYALQAISGLTGFRLWVAKILVKQFEKFLKSIGVAIDEKQKAKDQLAKDDAIITNPNTTPDQRRDADRDFLK